MSCLSIVEKGTTSDVLHKQPADLSNVVVSYGELGDKRIIMWLACQNWDEAKLELTADVDYVNMPVILSKSKRVSTTIKCEVTDRIVKLLMLIYPEKVGAIRKAVMLKHDVQTIINS